MTTNNYISSGGKDDGYLAFGDILDEERGKVKYTYLEDYEEYSTKSFIPVPTTVRVVPEVCLLKAKYVCED